MKEWVSGTSVCEAERRRAVRDVCELSPTEGLQCSSLCAADV